MNSIEKRSFDKIEFSALQSCLIYSARGNRYLEFLERLIKQRFDFNSLNVRLRRDAGIDEQRLERAKFARAPLIR